MSQAQTLLSLTSSEGGYARQNESTTPDCWLPLKAEKDHFFPAVPMLNNLASSTRVPSFSARAALSAEPAKSDSHKSKLFSPSL